MLVFFFVDLYPHQDLVLTFASLFTKDLVRVDTSQRDVVLPKGVEIVAENQGEWVDIIIPQYRLQELTNLQLPYTILIADMDVL